MVDIKSLATLELYELRSKFLAAGYDIRFVGGCVRDLLHGTIPKDIDLCTNATADEQIQIYKLYNIKYIETGLQHGTVTVILNNNSYEITSLRIDVETDGRHATVEYTRDWIKDLSRRDFTINAMSLDFDGNLIDPFGGLSDLQNGIVRFVGNAEERIKEDHLRMLRWFRFRARFENFNNPKSDIIISTMKVCCDNYELLFDISVERIWAEYQKILSGPNTDKILIDMNTCGVTSGSSITFFSFDRDDLIELKSKTNNPVTIFSFLKSGNAPYYLTKWNASNKDVDLSVYLTNSTRNDLFYEMAVKNIQREWVIELAAYKGLDNFQISVLKSWEIPKFPITGEDLINLKIEPGPKFGSIFSKLKEIWADNGYTTDKEFLFSHLSNIL